MWHVASRRQRGPAQRRPCRQTQAYHKNTTRAAAPRLLDASKRRKMLVFIVQRRNLFL